MDNGSRHKTKHDNNNNNNKPIEIAYGSKFIYANV